MQSKVALGQFYTKKNPFRHDAFLKWVDQFDFRNEIWLEPFAGNLDLIRMLKEQKICFNFKGFDVEPQRPEVEYNNSIKNFPIGYNVIITNPPYLAKNSAKRKGINFPHREYDDLYQVCISLCLENSLFVGAIIPESFITSDKLKDRLQYVISITESIFDDTDCPVCLALWGPGNTKDFEIFSGHNFIGKYSELKKFKSNIPTKEISIIFNNTLGQIGLIAIDNTKGPSIEFVIGDFIKPNKIKQSSRSLTRILVPNWVDIKQTIEVANSLLYQYREDTGDIFLTSFKGLRKDGLYRRRLDFTTARWLLENAIIIKEM